MKRILSSIVVLLIFLSCSVNCYAAEYEETYTGDVYGKYNYYSNKGIYTAISNDGIYEVITDNGVQIESIIQKMILRWLFTKYLRMRRNAMIGLRVVSHKML